MPAPAWDRVADETQVVLERAMRDEIRESSLADARRRLSSLVRLDLPDEDAAIVKEIAQALSGAQIATTNADKTEQGRQEARQRVEPVTTSIARSEIILRAGDIVTRPISRPWMQLGLRQTAYELARRARGVWR